MLTSFQFSSVAQYRVWLLATPWTAAHQASLFITNSQTLLKLMSIESVICFHFKISTDNRFTASQEQSLIKRSSNILFKKVSLNMKSFYSQEIHDNTQFKKKTMANTLTPPFVTHPIKSLFLHNSCFHHTWYTSKQWNLLYALWEWSHTVCSLTCFLWAISCLWDSSKLLRVVQFSCDL